MSRFISGVQLDKGVPLPKRQSHGKWLKVLDAMTLTTETAVGESFTVATHKEYQAIHHGAARVGMKIKGAKQKDGRLRIWRTK